VFAELAGQGTTGIRHTAVLERGDRPLQPSAAFGASRSGPGERKENVEGPAPATVVGTDRGAIGG